MTGNIHSHFLSDFGGALRSENILLEASQDDPAIEYVSYDNRDIKQGTLFFCKGVHFKEEYLYSAQKLGAVAYVSEKKYDCDLPCLIVSDVRRAMSISAVLHFDSPSKKITAAGITGTKGKSTTVYYLRSVLDDMAAGEGNPKTAILSSIDNYDGVICEEAHLTTPESIMLQHHFDNAVSSGIPYLVMEVSSQALKYGRTDGTDFDVACFHNIGTDHISPSEHADFEDYYTSKLKIFDMARIACVNTDADCAERTVEYARARCKVITYGSHPDDTVYCSKITKSGEGTVFHVKTPDYEGDLTLTMPGIFNVSNALAAVAMAHALNVPMKYVVSGLERARAGGRMQVYTTKDGEVTVIVDYAHNKMSFEALYDSVAVEYPNRKVVTVFGCAGGKAFLRRKDLGEITGDRSDYVIISEEDSGEEPFEQIAADVAKHIKGDNYCVCEDRGEAIYKAIFDIFDEKRIVLVTGKGEETRQKRGTVYVPCPSDAEYAARCIKEYDRRKETVTV